MTTIQVTDATRKRIRSMGECGDTYDTIINRVFDELHKIKARDDEIRAMNRDKRAWDKLWRDETNVHNR